MMTDEENYEDDEEKCDAEKLELRSLTRC